MAPQRLAGTGELPPQTTPRRTRPRVVTWVALGLVLALVAAGGFLALSALQPATPNPGGTAPRGNELPIVTTTPVPPEPNETVLTSGGDVGRTLPLKSVSGKRLGQISVTKATWTNQGEAEPAADQRYLILEVEVVSASRSLQIDPTMFEVTAGGQQYLPAFGPELADPLAGRSLQKGDRISGQIGYQLPAGPVSLRLLDPSLRELALVEVPGP